MGETGDETRSRSMVAEGKDGGPAAQRSTPSGFAAMGWAVLAAGALASLADAAIETFWSGSPVRWWVSPPAIVFVALSVWLWRPGGWAQKKWAWPGAATWAISGLLFMLAAAAWLAPPAGVGARLLGQDASVTMNLVAALVIVAAVIGTTRARVLPVAGIATIAALGLYAVAAFVLAWQGGVPFQASVAGAGFWARLPVFLQGAFLGAFLILPCSLLLEIVAVVRKQTNPWRWPQCVAAMLVVAIAAMGWMPGASGTVGPRAGRGSAGSAAQQAPAGTPSGPPAVVPGAQVPVTMDLAPPSPLPPAPTPEQLKARFEALAEALPTERFSAEAQARKLGPALDPIFSFVRDRIRVEAYSGVLRGPNGTLAARAGNSFDRSLLLSKMLAVHGIRTRFARGELAQKEADALFGRIFEGFQAPPAFTAASGDEGTEVRQFWARVTARARRDYTAIRPALGNQLPPPAISPREQALRDIRQHAWVQAEVEGKWVDLDASFAAAKPGTAFCAVARTVDEMPADWHQRVTVRVTEERLEGDKIAMTTALEKTLPAVDLIDEEIFLVHTPSRGGASALGLGAGSAPQGGDRWAPVLAIGEDVEVGRAMAFGDSAESTGFVDAFGGGGSSAFVAEWLEFDVQRPDGRKEVTRRTLVDRASASWRASKDHPLSGLRPLARSDEGLTDPRALRNIWFSAGAHNLRNYADMVMDLSVPSEPDPEAPLEIQLLPLAVSNFEALLWADHATIPAVNDLPDVRFYSDSPRIVVISATPDARGGVLEEFDLRRDWLCGVARDAAADAKVVDRKVWYAALEGALEHEALSSEQLASGVGASAVVSTSSLLTAEGLVVLGPSDVDRLPVIVRSSEKAARMLAALREGKVLAVPKAVLSSGPGGWWEFAPGGDARAVLDGDVNGSTLFNSGGGTKVISTRSGVVVIKEPAPEPGRLPRFGNRDPRPPKVQEKKSHGLEYTLVLSLMAIAAICAVKYLNDRNRAKAYQISLAKELADQGKR